MSVYKLSHDTSLSFITKPSFTPLSLLDHVVYVPGTVVRTLIRYHHSVWSLSTALTAIKMLMAHRDVTITQGTVQLTGHNTASTVRVQWNLSKVVTVLGSHLSKTASLPGPKKH